MISAHRVQDVRSAEAAVMTAAGPAAAAELLMHRAAAGLAAVVLGELRARCGGVYARRVLVLVGPGNNGGDALFAAAAMAARGVRVQAVTTSDQVHRNGLAALLAAGGVVVPVCGRRRAVQMADLVIDGLLGIGARPGLEDEQAELAQAVAETGLPVVSVDIPSGVDPDTGRAPGVHIRADVTVTFGTAKPCLLLPPASLVTGRVEQVDIGLGPYLKSPAVQRMRDADVADRWPLPSAEDDKYRRGVLGIVAGSAVYTGAALLTVGAAQRTGVGMVRYIGPEHPTELVRQRWPEVVPGQGRVQAWAIGSGVDPESGAGQRRAIGTALSSGLPCIADAGALPLLPPRVSGPTLLTPHAGELARLLTARRRTENPGAVEVSRQDVTADPLHHAAEAAAMVGATVLLKGAVTLVVSPQGEVRSEAEAPPWLATAGSGDVLAGIAGALLAAGLSPLDAGSMAAFLHGRAGQIASDGGPVSASDITDAVPSAVVALLRHRTAER